MKNTYLLLILVAILVTSCGSQKMANPYSTSELIAHDTQGIVTLRGVSDEFKEEPEAEANAHKKAIQHLFYMGFPGTDMKNPMIQKGQRIETENKAFLMSFTNQATNNTSQVTKLTIMVAKMRRKTASLQRQLLNLTIIF